MRKTALRHPARLAGSSLLRLQSDDRLAELAAAGHDAAFDAIVVRYRDALLRYCGAIVGSSRAEDAVQQTLLNAHAALGDADEVRHLRSWLYRIAHNVSLNLLRSVRDDVSLDASGAEGLRLPVTPASSESFEASEQFRATVAALQALPERQRAALVLRELEGRSHEEIADALGVSAGSARQHLMRARVAMRGAVTALTPWGLIVKLAELASSGGSSGGLETAAGAGLGAGLAKVTAGVMATGALVGGAAVGTHEVVRHDSAAPARADVIHAARKASSSGRAAPRVAAASVTTTAAAASPSAAGATSSAPARETEHHHRGRGHGHGSDHAKRGEDHRGGERGGGHDGREGGDDQRSTPQPPAAEDHRGRSGGKGAGDTASGHGAGETGSKSRGKHGGDDRSRSESGSRPGSSKAAGRSGKGGGDDTLRAVAPTTTSGSGDSGSGDSGSSGSSGSGSSDSGSSGSSGSGSSGSGDSGSSGSGKTDDDSSSGSASDG